jgi:hypothetical protein
LVVAIGVGQPEAVQMIPAPETLPGFPDAELTKPKGRGKGRRTGGKTDTIFMNGTVSTELSRNMTEEENI